ncbi:unnamed protein product [Rangifer tarandus platyrhynchus]|uniref:Uncharacterized protein n=2 Tax=Rangifer tarandus platyrhynchus TaxID=3082113 RepID=A0ABN8Y3E8_RANTA|nr:unnamed protein product [Rangifer tarandus platyrhynchus]CAI9693224.1 unnamed protein product [Rangifer tarandus platyrhynchus]
MDFALRGASRAAFSPGPRAGGLDDRRVRSLTHGVVNRLWNAPSRAEGFPTESSGCQIPGSCVQMAGFSPSSRLAFASSSQRSSASARHGPEEAEARPVGRRGGRREPPARRRLAPRELEALFLPSLLPEPLAAPPRGSGTLGSTSEDQGAPHSTPRGKQPPAGAGLSLAVCWGTLALKPLDALSVRFLTP